LESNEPPAFLWTSGKANRYNPAGIECIYFAEDLDLAILEYSRYMKLLGSEPMPFTTYFADAKLPILDLADAQILAALGLSDSDLHASWRLSSSLTKTQLLGLAVAQQRRFSAIRYPSDAAFAEGKTGFNYVIFRDCIDPAALLRVLTGNLVAVQEWP